MDKSKIFLNLGCGTDIRDKFINIDINDYPGTDIVADVRFLNMIKDGTVDFIVAQHLLEYIPRKDMMSTILMWRRKLKYEGIIEIRVGDIAAIAKSMVLNDTQDGRGVSNEMVISLMYGKQRDKYDIRFNGFSKSYLEGILVACEFEIINIDSEEFDFIITIMKPALEEEEDGN